MKQQNVLISFLLLAVLYMIREARYDNIATANLGNALQVDPNASINLCRDSDFGIPCTTTVPVHSESALINSIVRSPFIGLNSILGFRKLPAVDKHFTGSSSASQSGAIHSLALSAGTGSSIRPLLVGNIILVDGVKYPLNGDGISSAINDLPACTIPDFSQTWAHCGTIVLPPGTIVASSQIAITSPFVQIQGSGSVATYIEYTGTRGCAFAWTSIPFNSGGEGGAQLTDLTIDGSGASQGTCGIHYYDITRFTIRNVDIRFFKGKLPNSTTAGLWTDAQTQFDERPSIDVQLYDNAVGWLITSNNPNAGTTAVTIGYGSYNLGINVKAHEIGVLQENGNIGVSGEYPYLTFADMHLIFNCDDSSGSTGVSMTSGHWIFNNYNIHMEGCGTNWSLTPNGHRIEGVGNIQWNGGTNTLAGGSDIMTMGLFNFVKAGYTALFAGDPTSCNSSNSAGTFVICGRPGITPFAIQYAGSSAFAVDTSGGIHIGRNSTLLTSGAAPTIFGGFGSSPTIANNNGTVSFTVNVGGGGKAVTGVIGLPRASTGWNCFVNDITAAAANEPYNTRQISSTTTSATFQNQKTSTGSPVAWEANDMLRISCFAF